MVSCNSVEAIRLVGNQITDEGAQGFAAFLRSARAPPRLREINFHTNKIGAAGVASIVAALSGPCTLRILDLSFNPVGDEGAFLLARAVAENTCLEELSLGSKATSAAAAEALFGALRTNSTLVRFSLFWSSPRTGAEPLAVQNRWMTVLCASLADNRTLTSLYLTSNAVGLEEDLAWALLRNETLRTADFIFSLAHLGTKRANNANARVDDRLDANAAVGATARVHPYPPPPAMTLNDALFLNASLAHLRLRTRIEPDRGPERSNATLSSAGPAIFRACATLLTPDGSVTPVKLAVLEPTEKAPSGGLEIFDLERWRFVWTGGSAQDTEPSRDSASAEARARGQLLGIDGNKVTWYLGPRPGTPREAYPPCVTLDFSMANAAAALGIVSLAAAGEERAADVADLAERSRQRARQFAFVLDSVESRAKISTLAQLLGTSSSEASVSEVLAEHLAERIRALHYSHSFEQ